MNILIANPGTTSYKCRLFDMSGCSVLYRAEIDRIGESESVFIWQCGTDEENRETLRNLDYAGAVSAALTRMENVLPLSAVAAIGFKTVHAKGVTGCVELDDSVITAMQDYLPLAPVHTQAYLDAIAVFRGLVKNIPLVGLFETSFHQNIPPEAFIYGIPYKYYEKHGIRKYGFHGASHAYVAERVAEAYWPGTSAPKIISCHLGGSSSVCAIKDGMSVDTSMGMSPQCGLLNAKRVGDLDPFALLYLMEKEKMSIDEARNVLFSNGGLKGISGLSGDMRDIIEGMNAGNKQAEIAFKAFAYTVKKYIGEYLAVLNGADFIVFTGGMGERSALVREAVVGTLDSLGVVLDPQKNNAGTSERIISADASRVKIAIIPANEELIVARHVEKFLKNH